VDFATRWWLDDSATWPARHPEAAPVRNQPGQAKAKTWMPPLMRAVEQALSRPVFPPRNSSIAIDELIRFRPLSAADLQRIGAAASCEASQHCLPEQQLSCK